MADEIQRPRTRRAVLAAAAAGAAGLAVHSLGQPGATRAADGDTLLIGRSNDGSTVKFRSSGLAAIPAGSDRAIVTPPIVLRGKEKILVTLMGDPGQALLQHVKLHVARGVFTVFLTSPARVEVPFAWFVIS